MKCIDLKKEFGDKYKVTYEESYYVDHGKLGRKREPELMILLCKYGHIYPWGGNLLAACTNKSGHIM